MSGIDTSRINAMLAQLKAAEARLQGGVNPFKAGQTTEKSDFATALKSSLDQVNSMQTKADQLGQRFVAGDDSVNLSDVMISMQKANISIPGDRSGSQQAGGGLSGNHEYEYLRQRHKRAKKRFRMTASGHTGGFCVLFALNLGDQALQGYQDIVGQVDELASHSPDGFAIGQRNVLGDRTCRVTVMVLLSASVMRQFS